MAKDEETGASAAAGGARVKVLLLANSISIGGMEEHVRLLAGELDRARFEVFAVCPEWTAIDPFAEALRQAADHTERITPDRRHGLVRQPAEAWRLIRYVRRSRIEVVHLHSTTYGGQAVAAVCTRLGGAKSVYITEHLAPDQALGRFQRPWRDLFTRFVSGVVCVSAKNYRARSRWMYTPPKRTVVVPNGVDIKRFDPIEPGVLDALRQEHDIPADALVVGTAVRFEPEKGLDDLVAAFAAIHRDHPNALLLMVGDGSLRGELEAQVAELGLADATRFVGFTADARPYLGLMDVFVLPVPVGSMSIGLLEAMAMSLPCVMTFGGEGEAVVHAESGYCAEPRNPVSIAEFTNLLLGDDELRAKIGSAARTRVEHQFSSRQVADTLSALYQYGPAGMAAEHG